MISFAVQHAAAHAPWVLVVVKTALVAHIAAGSLAILSGFAAAAARKGERLHRAFGTAFFLSMLTMAAMGAFLAFFVPQNASVAGGILTFYLVATAWMAARQRTSHVGLPDRLVPLIGLGAGAAMLLWGIEAASSPTGLLEGGPPARFFVFAAFAAFAVALDLKVILQGGIEGTPRIARHLWRMCFALFFAASFFFIGQQKVMPAFLHGAPILLVPTLAPLALMVFWLVRVRLPKWKHASAS